MNEPTKRPFDAPEATSPFQTSIVGGGLPRALTSLVGRDRDLSAVRALILEQRSRLLTLTGTGGVGKTRLATAAAASVAEHFPAGVGFVELAGLSDPSLLLSTIAQALGVRDGRSPLLDRLAALLADRRTLLILDNLEHLRSASASLVDLLEACPALTILATSRAVLRLTSEQVFEVTPLDLPEIEGDVEHDDRSSGALDLFVDRAQLVNPHFALTAANAADLSQIVRRIDGIPLAIELAAARTRSLSPSMIAARLTSRLSVLTGGARDLPERQRTMRDTIAWSHDLLAQDEQVLFRRLASFAGGFSLDAAEALVAPGETSTPVIDIVASLVDHSLLKPVAGADGENRFLLLEVVREYAEEQLVAANEIDLARTRHGDYFVDLAEAIAPNLGYRADAAASVSRLNVELDNLRSALSWTSELSDSTRFLRLSVALQSFWSMGGRAGEGRMWLDQAMELSESAPLPLRAAVVRASGWIARHQGRHDQAEALGLRGLALSRKDGDPVAIVHALSLLGWVEDEQGEPARSRAYHQQVLELSPQLADPLWAAWATRHIGKQHLALGETKKAEQWLERAVALFRAAGLEYGVAVANNILGEIALSRGEYARAAVLRREWLAQSWDATGLRFCLEGLINVAVTCNEPVWAAKLIGAAESHRLRLGVGFNPRQVPEYERNLAAIRRAINPSELGRYVSEGKALSVEQSRALAGDFISFMERTRPAPPRDSAAELGLTAREAEIARLLVNGRTNREIAETLFISIPTVKRHLTNMLGKLGVANRQEAADLIRARHLE
jgi:non-specific serine/threonine protein kinase